MLQLEFLRLRYLQLLRGNFWNTNVLGIIFAILGLGYMFISLYIGAWIGGQAIAASSVTNDLVFATALVVLLIILPFELLLRFFITKPVDQSLLPLYVLPISKRRVQWLVLGKVFVSGWWLYPVSVMAVLLWQARLFGSIYSYVLLLCMACLFIGNGLLNTGLKIWAGRRAGWVPLVLLALIVVLVVVVSSFISFKGVRRLVLDVVPLAVTVAVCLLYMLGTLLFAMRQVAALKYPEQISAMSGGREKASGLRFAALSRLGLPGEMMAMELRLIFRHKRTRTVVFFSLFFLAYGLVMMSGTMGKEDGKSGLFVLMFNFFFTAMLLYNYGQFMPSWEAKYFDGTLTRPGGYRNWLMGKYLLLACFAIVPGLLAAAVLAFMAPASVGPTLGVTLFNAGFGSFMVLFCGAYNYKRLDLTRSHVFNWQGVGGTQFVVMLPALFIMFICMGLGVIFRWTWQTAMVPAAIGLLTMLSTPLWLPKLQALYLEKKYKQASLFRSTE